MYVWVWFNWDKCVFVEYVIVIEKVIGVFWYELCFDIYLFEEYKKVS